MSSAIRVAHTIHGLGLGGAQKVVASIVRESQGDEFRHFVYSSSGGIHSREIAEAGAEVRVLSRRIPKIDLGWLLRLALAMKEDRVDLVHCHLFGDSLHGYLAARLRGDTPVILTLHSGPKGWTPLQCRVYPWLVRMSSTTVACSESVRTLVYSNYPSTKGKIVAIPNGISVASATPPTDEPEMSLREALGLPKHAKLVASIGRLAEPKGLPYLVSAFAEVSSRVDDEDVRLVLIGDGHLRAELEAQVDSMRLGDKVVFAGFRDDVYNLMDDIDVIVFSSLHEGMPIALLEAMSLGRCLVCTEIPGFLEAVRPDKEALIVPPARSDLLADAIEEAIGNPRLRHELGARAQARFLGRFTADNMVRRYTEIYRNLT